MNKKSILFGVWSFYSLPPLPPMFQSWDWKLTLIKPRKKQKILFIINPSSNLRAIYRRKKIPQIAAKYQAIYPTPSFFFFFPRHLVILLQISRWNTKERNKCLTGGVATPSLLLLYFEFVCLFHPDLPPLLLPLSLILPCSQARVLWAV